MQLEEVLAAFEGRSVWQSIAPSGKIKCDREIARIKPPDVFDERLFRYLQSHFPTWNYQVYGIPPVNERMYNQNMQEFDALVQKREQVRLSYLNLKRRVVQLKKETTATMCRVCTDDIKDVNNLLRSEEEYRRLCLGLMGKMRAHPVPGHGPLIVAGPDKRSIHEEGAQFCTARLYGGTSSA